MLFTHPDGEAAKLPEAEVRSTRASSEKLNAANKTFSFLDLRISNFSMLILTIIGNFFPKKKLPTFRRIFSNIFFPKITDPQND